MPRRSATRKGNDQTSTHAKRGPREEVVQLLRSADTLSGHVRRRRYTRKVTDKIRCRYMAGRLAESGNCARLENGGQGQTCGGSNPSPSAKNHHVRTCGQDRPVTGSRVPAVPRSASTTSSQLSSILTVHVLALVAQRTERRPPETGVAGSIPVEGTQPISTIAL